MPLETGVLFPRAKCNRQIVRGGCNGSEVISDEKRDGGSRRERKGIAINARLRGALFEFMSVIYIENVEKFCTLRLSTLL